MKVKARKKNFIKNSTGIKKIDERKINKTFQNSLKRLKENIKKMVKKKEKNAEKSPTDINLLKT